MAEHDASDYVRLSQFLELQSQWWNVGDSGELCHRICRTAALLLDTPTVAIGFARHREPYRIVAAEGDWGGDPARESVSAGLLHAARSTGAAQVKSTGEASAGIFPLPRREGQEGYLHVRLARPLFRAHEISFLRFLASLAGIAICGGTPLSQEDGGRRLENQGGHDTEGAARRYVAMAVHDMRNPLNVMAGYAGLLSDGSLGKLDDSQREAVEAIVRQVGVLLSVVDQLIELDQMARGAIEISASRFDLREFFEEVHITCFPYANGRMHWPGPEAAFEFTTDRRRLFAIVQNLVDNALRHTTDGPVRVDCTRKDRQLLIDVSDVGPGLGADLRTKLVTQARTGAESAPRSGLGLYSVASHVHTLNGAIEVEQPSDGGTRIRVIIPASSQRVVEPVVDPELDTAGQLVPSANSSNAFHVRARPSSKPTATS